ncbi:MAG TPA: SHOCT domain-containing protein [Candidatus Binatia bacterium]|jgi:putative membrane protein|nr:SHOCT domain-containing protein [Candidatus Binatia bacterium]
MMTDGMGMMGMMIFMFLFGLLLIVLFVLIVVVVVKWLSGSKMPFSVSDRENALEILTKRYAKGEIGKEEFERIKKDIE